MSNAVYRPSILAPKLLEFSEQATAVEPPSILSQSHCRTIWARHEWTRKIYEEVKRQFTWQTGRSIRVPAAFVVSADKPIGVVRVGHADADTIKLVAVPSGEAPMQTWIRHDAESARSDVFGVTVCVAGLDVYEEGYPEKPVPPPAKTGETVREKSEWPLLAAATKTDEGTEVLKVQVHLANSALFYARHRQRTLWLAAIIVSASAAAVLGWIATRRAFHRHQQLVEMKTNFVSSVSHELRAPIASVRLMAEGLESGRIKDEVKQRDYFKFIVQECRRLSSLIENVLDFSRIEQGRKQYEFEPTDVTALIRQTAKLMEPYAAEREVRLEVRIENSSSARRVSSAGQSGRCLPPHPDALSEPGRDGFHSVPDFFGKPEEDVRDAVERVLT